MVDSTCHFYTAYIMTTDCSGRAFFIVQVSKILTKHYFKTLTNFLNINSTVTFKGARIPPTHSTHANLL